MTEEHSDANIGGCADAKTALITVCEEEFQEVGQIRNDKSASVRQYRGPITARRANIAGCWQFDGHALFLRSFSMALRRRALSLVW